MTPQEIEIAEPSPAALTCAAGWLAGRAAILLQDNTWVSWAVGKVTSSQQVRFDQLARLEADIARACKARNITPPSLQTFFARRIELARVLGMQCWARDQFQEGNPQARLGLADAVMEEVLILDEERND